VFTPRIWAAASLGEDARLLLGSVARSQRSDGAPVHGVWSLGQLTPGSGALLSTYEGDQQALRSARLPIEVATAAPGLTEVLAEVWSALEHNVRVAALAIDPDAFGSTPRIINTERH
jgi:hypothetical protein